MKLVRVCKNILWVTIRKTEGLLRTYGDIIPKVSDYTTIYKRVNRLDINVDQQVGNDVIIAVDSTGIKVANRGEWMRDTWKRRKGS